MCGRTGSRSEPLTQKVRSVKGRRVTGRMDCEKGDEKRTVRRE